MGLRIFLTGVSGYLGSVLAVHLAQAPEVESITGIDWNPPIAPLPEKVRFQRMDIRSPELAAAMSGHTVVVHTAFVVLWQPNMSVAERDEINLNGVRNVAQAAIANSVRRFVHASSTSAYDPILVQGKTNVTEDFPIGAGNSYFYYANGKALAERSLNEILAGTGIPLTIFRPFYIIGPRNRETVKGFRTAAARIPGHNGRLQYIHEDDVASAFLQAACEDLPGAYNIVPDDCIRLNDVWEILGLKFVPPLPLGLARLAAGIRWRFLGSPTHPAWVDAIIGDATFSNARLRATGWKPRYTSADALRSALQDSSKKPGASG